MKDQLLLFLRVFVLYPAGGAIASIAGGIVAYDDVAQTLTVDLNAASVALAGVISATISGGTFAWSRFLKAKGGAT